MKFSVQLPERVKTVWSGELSIACCTEVNAPGVAPEQSMAAEFSVWANDRAEVRKSNRKTHNGLGPKEVVIVILTPLEPEIGDGVAEFFLQQPARLPVGSEGIIEEVLQKCHKKITIKR